MLEALQRELDAVAKDEAPASSGAGGAGKAFCAGTT
jgi:hypothetical protein